MNKFLNIFISVTILTINYGCDSVNKSVNIEQFNVDYPLVIRLSKEKTVIRLQFPNKIKVENKSLVSESFVEIEYNYNNIPLERDLRMGLYEEKDKKLIKISNNKKKIISPKSQLEYVFYTRHFVDSAKAIQQQFKPYIEKMLRLKKDTLHIGTVAEYNTLRKLDQELN